MRKFGLFFAILLTAAGFTDACANNVEPGVSHELARHRKATVKDVVYNLSLTVDSVSGSSPDGKILISFIYTPDNLPLQLDFTGQAVKTVCVNGRMIANPEWREEHIIIANSDLSEGYNSVEVEFVPAERAMNRNPAYVYTLFVPNRAHSVFPCFDQPDLKATYNLTLTVPAQWKAVSNSPVVRSEAIPETHERIITFGPTEPLSTYLFAFAAGEFDFREYTSPAGRTIGAYYRETDPYRLAQLDEIFSQVESSLCQLEEYTGISYPFAKYDLVILPGFQFGGMEHTGATFYNDNTVFLGKNATGADELSRAKVIAHETAHMWFGDFVTMEWFDDVWTKEVFANFFAARLVRQLLPEFDHDLEWLRVYMAAALDQDRSDGATPIRQDLDNLRNAGLIYNNIIYNKSPLMMGKLAEITGEESFRLGIRKYLAEHAYSNATWDDLIKALSAYTDEDLEQFSRVWVYEAGMPRIDFTVEGGKLVVSQTDPRGRGIVWPQTFNVVVRDGSTSHEATIKFEGTMSRLETSIPVQSDSALIIPTADGRIYGLPTVDSLGLQHIMADALNPEGILAGLSATGRLATLMMLNENYLANRIRTSDWLDFLITAIGSTTDSQMLSALTRYVGGALIDLNPGETAPYEQRLFEIAQSHPVDQGKTLVMRKLIANARAPHSIDTLYRLWAEGVSPALGKDDFSELALHLAVALPDRADSIITTQRNRIGSGDRLRRFDFISRAAVSDTLALDSLFKSLSDPASRLVEPWTLSMISLLNHPLRQHRSIKYLTPALEMLPDLQATGDIFFPANWSAALLGSYRSKAAAAIVTRFLEENRSMNPLLLNKVRQAAARLIAKQR